MSKKRKPPPGPAGRDHRIERDPAKDLTETNTALASREQLYASASFDQLLDGLGSNIASEAKKSLSSVDRKVLRLIIVEVDLIYKGTRMASEQLSRSTLHDLRTPITRVLELLKHDVNIDDVLVALGAPANLALSPDQRAVERAVARYEALLDDLHQIEHALPPSPARPGRGRPIGTKDLRALVEKLADYWVRATGKPFTQDWQDNEPITHGAQFVHAVVRFVDSGRLKSLPRVTAMVVAARRAAAKSRSSPTLRK